MKENLANVIEGMLHSPLLPEIVETLQRRVSDEAERRGEFYRQLHDEALFHPADNLTALRQLMSG